MHQEQIRSLDTLLFPASSFDPATGVATFGYRLTGPGGLAVEFTETVRLPVPAEQPAPEVLDRVRRVLDLLHVVAGVSYYKIAAPRTVRAPAPVAGAAAALFTAVYTKGLAEYAYRNDVPHVLDLEVEVPGRVPDVAPVAVGGRPLSAVGGGKDSIVSLELMRAAGLDPVPFSVNPNPVIERVNAASGLPPLAARRRLDPRLLELNQAGARNGHIPVTAINSLVAIATATLHGLGPVVMSNERSASDPNLVWHGHEVNHQWSKGVEAEGLLREAVTAHAGLAEPYFSLLRPLSELHIAQLFARWDAYDGVVTSCNAAFKLSGASERWCGHCPKCRFVFLAMAPAMPRERVVGIFGADLLDDPDQLPGYRELLGVAGHKPFECVGEVEECVVALGMLLAQPPWSGAAVVEALRHEVPQAAWSSAGSRAAMLTPADIGFLPPAYGKLLADAIA